MGEFYRTVQGDTWDQIAKNVYGDETKIGILLENNLDCIDIVVFDSGTLIYVPGLSDDEEDAEEFPDWRYDDDEEDDEQ